MGARIPLRWHLLNLASNTNCKLCPWGPTLKPPRNMYALKTVLVLALLSLGQVSALPPPGLEIREALGESPAPAAAPCPTALQCGTTTCMAPGGQCCTPCKSCPRFCAS